MSRISLAEGLSQSIVYDIAQDDAGYLWFGTQDGLNRFDGINFEIFKNEPFDTTSISSNQISALLYDKNKRLWAGTHHNGLNLFDNKSRTFSLVYFHNPENEKIAGRNSIRCLFEDSQGNIWSGTPTGITSIDKNFNKTDFDLNFEGDTTPVFVNSFLESKDYLFIATGRGIFILNKITNEINFLTQFSYEPYKRQWVFKLIFDEANNLFYAGTHTGLYTFKFSHDSISEITPVYQGAPVATLKKINNKIITAIDGDGVYYVENNQLISIKKNLAPSMQATDVSEVISIHADKINNGVLWMGTSTRGVLKFVPVLKNFHTQRLTPFGAKTSFVTAIIKDKFSNKWVGTPDGLYRIDPAGLHLKLDEEIKINKLRKNYISALHQDSHGRLWVAKINGVLYSENINSDKPVFKIAGMNETSKTENPRYFYESRKNDLYLLSRTIIYKYDNKNNEFTAFITDPDSVASKQPGYTLNSMLIDRGNNTWIATTAGLILFKNGVQQPEFIYHKKDDHNSLRDHTIQHIYEDSRGNIWLATSNGFSKIILKDNKINIHNYSSRDGLGNNFVYSVVEDKAENKLWLSTNGGLTCFNPEKNQFITFNIHDGLQSNEFNSGAFSVSEDGEMFFGGIDGYTHFYPTEIKIDSTPPNVHIASFYLPGKDKKNVYFDSADNAKRIELKHNQNSFTVNFAGLHYINPVKNTFAYKLEGYQNDWIYSGNINSINFSQLPPGEYQLRVKAANSDGIYNDTGDILTISISPAFWNTAWFYTILIVLTGLILYGLHRYRLSLKMQQVLAIDKIRKETAEDFHDELGHKLTTISWFGEIVKSKLKPGNDEAKIYLDKIIETSQQMYHTMKDLLWAMDPDKDTVNDLYTQIKEFGEDLFDRTGIEFDSESNVELNGNKILPLHHKRQVILIFKELMHNTLKHSGANKAQFKLIRSNGQIHFQFADNGRGYVYNGQSSGFGLKNVKRRSQLLNADLKINSNLSGTSIDLSFSSN